MILFQMVIYSRMEMFHRQLHYQLMRMVVYHQLHHPQPQQKIQQISMSKVTSYHVAFVVFSNRHVVWLFYPTRMLLFSIVNKISHQFLTKKANSNIVSPVLFQLLNKKALLLLVFHQQQMLVVHRLAPVELFVSRLSRVYYVLS